MNRQRITYAVASLSLALAAATTSAAPVVFFGENQSPAGVVSGAPETARTSFLAGLTGAGSEGFEGSTANTGATSVAVTFPGSSGGITATLSGGGVVGNTTGVVDVDVDPLANGRFNTTPSGKQWWLAGSAFSLDFDSPISAFGFYGTDIGDFNGSLTVTLTDLANIETRLTVANTVNGQNGSLLFWGFIDSTTQYDRIQFGNTAQGFDGFGFDDFVVADIDQTRPPTVTVPEPGTLALAGLSLLGLAAARRRRRA